MFEYVVDLGVSIPEEFGMDVCDRLCYAHSGIERVEVLPEDTRHIKVFAQGELDIAALQPILVSNAKEMLKSGLESTTIILHDRRDQVAPPERSAFQELVNRNWLVPISRGSFAKKGPAFRLMSHLDELFRRMSLDHGAEEMEFSTFMSVESLRKAGHFNASPQHITFANHLTEDLEFLKEVAAAAREKEVDLEQIAASHYESNGACLSPAVCYNLYHTLQDQEIKETKVVAAVNKCYRFESGRLEGLARLWEFTMRELIFVGRSKDVAERRMQALEDVWKMAERWNLHAWIENANDPFFIGEFSSRAAFQRNREMKFELRLSVAGDFSVAATSFNLHSTTFGNNFNMRLPNGRPACSGCCAWGEERWLLALFSQFGFDPAGWPPDLAEAVWI